MLDDDDLDFTILAAGGGGGGCLGATLALVIIIVIAVIVTQNKTECSAMKCPEGTSPKLMKNECLCVVKAKPQ